MEAINNNEQQEQKSQFCETLMKVTGAIGHLANPGDTAIVLCSDGKAVSSRLNGIYLDVLHMVLVKMQTDDRFAEMIMEASIMYSARIQQTSGETPQSEEAAAHAEITKAAEQREREKFYKVIGKK